VESKLGPLGTAAIYCPIVPARCDCEDVEFFGGMKIGRGNRSTRRKLAPAQLCPPQIPLDHTRDRTRAAAVGSQRLTASAMARPYPSLNAGNKFSRPYTRRSKVTLQYILILPIVGLSDQINAGFLNCEKNRQKHSLLCTIV
jgi:hypothetical protein